MGLLDGRVVLVSGVGPGLGRSVAAACLREGASVALGDLDGARAAAIRDELDPKQARSVVASLDITSVASCEALVAQTESRFGRAERGGFGRGRLVASASGAASSARAQSR